MITHEDQLSLFKIISNKLKKDISCYAFGGTAMMFYGYKDETKDIDILFENKEERNAFIEIIEALGFEETSPIKIYIPEKLRDKNRPLMYKREDYRIDIFVEQIFQTRLSPKMKEDLFAVHDFKDKHLLRINVLRKEHLVLLKAVTERQNDFDDIRNIIERDKNFDWQYFIDEVLWQSKNGNSWALYDVEKMMLELKKYIIIEQKYFKQLYSMQDKDINKSK
ncbi:hypothetical protein HYU06_05640 [Candidatus Woesearchaeota archaeon]|nr:hypothetical protein [Candidatus Woesearchaeota archaeon]